MTDELVGRDGDTRDSDEIEDVSGHYPEASARKKQLNALKVRNERTIGRLGMLGATLNPKSLDEARDTHLLGWIYEHVLTEAQREDFGISWQTAYAEQLEKVEGQARERTVRNSRARIITPGGDGTPRLILP